MSGHLLENIATIIPPGRGPSSHNQPSGRGNLLSQSQVVTRPSSLLIAGFDLPLSGGALSYWVDPPLRAASPCKGDNQVFPHVANVLTFSQSSMHLHALVHASNMETVSIGLPLAGINWGCMQLRVIEKLSVYDLRMSHPQRRRIRI